ncbi:MAG TPA: hypothetical protein VFV38_10180 [Ktedonobacteraceae bacterium]|nr:hypothetical protein [Ktedonobacteraceae bacterium]
MENSETTCRNRHCHVLLGGPCEAGEPDFRKCPNFAEDRENGIIDDIQSKDEGTENETSFVFPWHGSSLGLDDVRFLAARGPLHVVAIFGTYNAGKTTFLSTLYLLLTNGVKLQAKSFAGSLTLRSWERLASGLRLPGKRFSPGAYPSFPPHTQSRNARVPGLLHLAFRDTRDEVKDYLFTDPPGEWFEHWAENENGPMTEGARWMARHATTIAIFADSEALTGPRRGEERQKLSDLMFRLSSSTHRQCVALIWTKADIPVKNEIKRRLEAEFHEYFQRRQTRIFSIAAVPQNEGSKIERGQGVVEVVNWLTNSTSCRETIDMQVLENIMTFAS